MKNQFKSRKLPCPRENTDAVCKAYVDSCLNDPSTIRKTAHVDFSKKNLDNVRFVKVKCLFAVQENLTPQFYVYEAISHSVDESPLLRLDPVEKLKLVEQDSIFLNSTLTSPKTIIEIPNESYADSFHEINRKKTRFLIGIKRSTINILTLTIRH